MRIDYLGEGGAPENRMENDAQTLIARDDRNMGSPLLPP